MADGSDLARTQRTNRSERSPGDDINPYREWLGIDCAGPPSTHYELLGLTSFENDQTQIRVAFDIRYEQIHKYIVGKYEERAVTLQEEIAAALRALTNDHTKAAYDRNLREELASRQTVATEPEAIVTIVEDAATVVEDAVIEEVVIEDVVIEDVVIEEDAAVLEAHPVDVAAPLPKPSPPLPAAPAESQKHQRHVSPAFMLLVAGFGVLGIFLVAGGALMVFSRISGSSPTIASEETTDAGAIASVPAENAPSDPMDESQPAASESAAEITPRDPWPESEVQRGSTVAWSGTLQQVSIMKNLAGREEVHVLLAATDPESTIHEVEGYTEQVDFIRELADYVARDEQPRQADKVTIRGEVMPPSRGAARIAQTSLTPMIRLDGMEKRDGLAAATVGQQRTFAELSETSLRCVRALRTPGQLTHLCAVIQAKSPNQPRWLIAEVENRRVCIVVPTTWESEFAALEVGQQVTILASRVAGTDAGSPLPGEPVLIVAAETIGQVAFSEVRQSPERFVDKPLRVAARHLRRSHRGTQVSLDLEVLDVEETSPAVTLTGATTLAGLAAFDTLSRGELVDVELQIDQTGDTPNYRLVSIVSRGRPELSIAFDKASSAPPNSPGRNPPPVGIDPTRRILLLDTPQVELIGQVQPVTNLSWAPDGNSIVVLERGLLAKRWALNGKVAPQALAGVMSVPQWSPSGKFWAESFNGRDLTLYDTLSSSALAATRVSDAGSALAGWVQGDWFFAMESGGRLSLRHPDAWTTPVTWETGALAVSAVAGSSHRDRVAISERLRGGYAINIRSLPGVNESQKQGGPVAPLVTLPSENAPYQLSWRAAANSSVEHLVAFSRGQIVVWHLSGDGASDVRGTVLNLPAATRWGDPLLSFRSDNLAVVHSDGEEVVIHDTTTGAVSARQRGGFSRLEYAPTSDLLACVAGASVAIESTAGGFSPLARLTATSPIVSIAWHPQSTQLATAHEDHVVRVWDLRAIGSGSPDQQPVTPVKTRSIFDLESLSGWVLDLERRREWSEFHKWIAILERAPLSRTQARELAMLRGRVIKRAEDIVRQAAFEQKETRAKTPLYLQLLNEASQCDPTANGWGARARRMLEDS